MPLKKKGQEDRGLQKDNIAEFCIRCTQRCQEIERGDGGEKNVICKQAAFRKEMKMLDYMC